MVNPGRVRLYNACKQLGSHVFKSLVNIPDVVQQRLNNPFLGSFLLAEGAWNYKAILVLTALEPYHVKFAYLENVLYQSAPVARMQLLWLPLVSAALYTVGWPLVDIAISAILRQIEMWKKRALLKVERTEPMNMAEQVARFEEAEAELSRYRDRINASHKRNIEIVNQQKAELEKTRERLRRQTLVRLALGGGIDYIQFSGALDNDAGHGQHSFSQTLQAIKRMPRMAVVGEFLEKSQKLIAPNYDNCRMADIKWLQANLSMGEEDVLDVIEILIALDLINAPLLETMTFEVKSHDLAHVRRIKFLIDYNG